MVCSIQYIRVLPIWLKLCRRHFECIVLNKKIGFTKRISLKYVSNYLITDTRGLVHVMAVRIRPFGVLQKRYTPMAPGAQDSQLRACSRRGHLIWNCALALAFINLIFLLQICTGTRKRVYIFPYLTVSLPGGCGIRTQDRMIRYGNRTVSQQFSPSGKQPEHGKLAHEL